MRVGQALDLDSDFTGIRMFTGLGLFFTDFGFLRWFGFRISHGFGFLEIRVTHGFGFQGSWIYKDLDSQGLGFSHSSDSDLHGCEFHRLLISQRFRFIEIRMVRGALEYSDGLQVGVLGIVSDIRLGWLQVMGYDTLRYTSVFVPRQLSDDLCHIWYHPCCLAHYSVMVDDTLGHTSLLFS